jgi:lipopolysaccharide/colanic/teichoic acid biosynthesis glycosyltransferase
MLPLPLEWDALDAAGELIESPSAAAAPLFGWSLARRVVKRLIDVVVGVASIALLLPLMALVAAAIVIDSRGWPIYVQRRLGRFGADFPLLKFRTMVKNAEQMGDELFETDPKLKLEWRTFQKVRDDPRVTRVGKLLRKFSLDEIPQLINVALGHMSLVGPRPVLDGEIQRFGKEVPLILSVRPGLTGLWAVSGRSDISYEERAALESRYIREFDLGLDLWIVVKTVPRVIVGKGAV